MAPECLEGANVSALADQYSFSVTLYEGLCGHRPFKGSSIDEVRASRALGPPWLDAVGAGWLLRVVVRGLSPLAADRYPSMDALLLELEPGRHRVRRNAAWALMGRAKTGRTCASGDPTALSAERTAVRERCVNSWGGCDLCWRWGIIGKRPSKGNASQPTRARPATTTCWQRRCNCREKPSGVRPRRWSRRSLRCRKRCWLPNELETSASGCSRTWRSPRR